MPSDIKMNADDESKVSYLLEQQTAWEDLVDVRKALARRCGYNKSSWRRALESGPLAHTAHQKLDYAGGNNRSHSPVISDPLDAAFEAQHKEAGTSSVDGESQSSATSAQEQVLREEAAAVFAKADRDKNGSLSHSELKKEIQQDDGLRQRLSAAKWKTFFLEIDVNGDGVITQKEFVTYYVKTAQEQVLREEAAAVFAKADLDKNGLLSPFELKKEIQQDEQLWQRLSAAKWITFFLEIDVNGDGVITQEEFVTHYVKTALITSSPRLSAKSAIDLGPSAAEVLSSLSPGDLPVFRWNNMHSQCALVSDISVVAGGAVMTSAAAGASPKRATSGWKSSWGLPPGASTNLTVLLSSLYAQAALRR